MKGGGIINLLDFFRNLFGGKSRFTLDGISQSDFSEAVQAYRETAIQRIALSSAVGLIANTISKCELKTYLGGIEAKGDEYYLWNVRPNANENASEFWQKFVWRLCLDNECLIIFDRDTERHVDEAFVADTFAVKDDNVFTPKTYSGVSIGSLALNKIFFADDVLHYKLNNEAVRQLLDSFYGSYKKLMESALKAFTRSRGEQGVLETIRTPGNVDYEATLRDMKQAYFDPYFKGDSVVLPLFDGQKYSKINSAGQRELADAGDTRKLIDDIFDITARVFRIPPALLRGEMADTGLLMTNYLTFCIDPFARMIADEVNAKRYKKDKFLAGDYLKVDTSSVKHFDLLDAATAVDKLISSGTVNINELRESISMTKIDADWANRHWITKNYTEITNLDSAEGGETTEQDN